MTARLTFQCPYCGQSGAGYLFPHEWSTFMNAHDKPIARLRDLQADYFCHEARDFIEAEHERKWQEAMRLDATVNGPRDERGNPLSHYEFENDLG